MHIPRQAFTSGEILCDVFGRLHGKASWWSWQKANVRRAWKGLSSAITSAPNDGDEVLLGHTDNLDGPPESLRQENLEGQRRRRQQDRVRKSTNARERAWKAGKEFGFASMKLFKEHFAIWILRPMSVVFTWSDFLARFKDRDARRRAAWRRQSEEY